MIFQYHINYNNYTTQMSYSVDFKNNIQDLDFSVVGDKKMSKVIQADGVLTVFYTFEENGSKKLTILEYQSKGDENEDVEKQRLKVKVIETHLDQSLELQNVMFSCFSGEQCFIVQQNPIKLFFLHNKEKYPIPVVLPIQMPLREVKCTINFPQMLIYGHNQQDFTNHIFAINLNTFQTKQICNGKGYSPKGRSQHFCHFSQNRLYVMGGIDKDEGRMPELFWTFDFQKGYWFAIDIQLNKNELLEVISCEFDRGKVLLFKDNNWTLLELYQSKMTDFDHLLKQKLEIFNVLGVFHRNKWVYLYDDKGVLPISFQIIRHKKKKQ